jgi:cytochrome c
LISSTLRLASSARVPPPRGFRHAIVQGTFTSNEEMPMRVAAFLTAISIVVLSAGQSLAQDAAAGEKVFAKCKACHVADEDKNKIGPTLKGVIGRTVGTLEGYKYSPAMVEAGKGGMVWDDATLTGYLKAPKEVVKGTKMAFPGLKKDEDLANVIAYLKQFP